MNIPKSRAELIKIAEHDPKFIIETGFRVVDKNRDEIPFIFNNNQNKFYYSRTPRDDVLKGGQFGMSTLILAMFTVKFMFLPNVWSVSISHEAEATRRLFSKVDYWLNPKNMADWIRPFVRFSEDTQKNIVNEINNARFYIGTAGARAFGRGDTIHYAHLSEISRWQDSGAIVTGILRAMPMTSEKETWAVKETTANGQGNYHHIEWQREKRGETDELTKHKFTPHFLSWLDQEEYRIKDAQIPDDDYNDEELYIKERFGADDEQLVWRRNMIGQLGSEDGRTPEEIFKQEFPLDDEEAFLFSGNPVFSPQKVKAYKAVAEEPVLVGNLIGVVPQQIFDENEKGSLKIYEPPDTEGQYVIFGDVGQFSDYCSAHVYDRRSWEMVAHFHARIRSNQFGKELNILGHFYNKALIAVEANNMGQSTIDKLIDLSYPYLYKRKRLDKINKREVDEYGWYTTEQTKALIIGNLQALLMSEEAHIPDMDTLNEMGTYVRTATGKMEANEGCFDDRVISVSGCLYMLKLHPYIAPPNIVRKTAQRNKAKSFKRLRSSKKSPSRGSSFGRRR